MSLEVSPFRGVSRSAGGKLDTHTHKHTHIQSCRKIVEQQQGARAPSAGCRDPLNALNTHELTLDLEHSHHCRQVHKRGRGETQGEENPSALLNE